MCWQEANCSKTGEEQIHREEARINKVFQYLKIVYVDWVYMKQVAKDTFTKASRCRPLHGVFCKLHTC